MSRHIKSAWLKQKRKVISIIATQHTWHVQKYRINTSAITIDRNLLARSDSSSATSENGSSCSWKTKYPFKVVSNMAHKKIREWSEAVSSNRKTSVWQSKPQEHYLSYTWNTQRISRTIKLPNSKYRVPKYPV